VKKLVASANGLKQGERLLLADWKNLRNNDREQFIAEARRLTNDNQTVAVLALK
jgi:hypothetical protein